MSALLPMVELRAVCLDCKIRHEIRVPPGPQFLREMDEWQHKHWGHRIEFASPRREIPKDFDDKEYMRSGQAPWWLEHAGFRHNTNIKIAFASSRNLTITLASLATDASLLTGRASTIIDETSDLYLDEGVGGFTTTGTSPTTAKEIDIYAYAALDDVPTYPDAITGTDAAKTVTSSNILNAGLKLTVSIITSATSDQKSYFGPMSLASLFGGFMPPKWGVFVTHNTGVNLNSTAGNHQITAKPLYVVAA